MLIINLLKVQLEVPAHTCKQLTKVHSLDCRYVATLKESTDIDTQMETEFIVQQLLSMIQYMELADQSSR